MAAKKVTKKEADSARDKQEFKFAIERLHQLLLDQGLDAFQPLGPAAVYTTTVTLWMLVLQRLGGGATLKEVVRDILSNNPEFLPKTNRLRDGTLSQNSAAYSEARNRLKLETVAYFADRVSGSFMESSPPWFDGRRAFIIDGTTITLPPTPELRKAFPPATNQHGDTVWPVALLLTAHEVQSGCALPPEVGAMYGEEATSEAQLAKQLMARIAPDSLLLADSGFGIFGVAHHAVQSGHQILFRLTKVRFNAMVQESVLVEKSNNADMYKLKWTPSKRDRQSNSDLPRGAAIDVTLHAVEFKDDVLYLVTTLDVDSAKAAEYYGRRYDVEHDIRDVKVTLDTENIRPRSASDWSARYEQALKSAAQEKLPNRPGRSYPRRAHLRRQKSTKFMKQLANQNAKQKADSATKPK